MYRLSLDQWILKKTKIVFGGQKTFYIVSKCGPELVESVPREQYASSETVLQSAVPALLSVREICSG